MIITKTPLRISLFGGGTDLPEFFRRYSGAVISFSINKNIYVSVNDKFDGQTRVSYSITENVADPADLQHDIVRETLKFHNLRGLEITSISDIPGSGTGLGSSSAFTVGLIAALSARSRNGSPYCKSLLSETAYTIEANLCGHPCGKQDHYVAAYGGLHHYAFNTDGTVSVQPLDGKEIVNNLMLFWTGVSRSANEILGEHRVRLKSKNEGAVKAGLDTLYLTQYMHQQIDKGDLSDFGKMLHLGWKLKKRMNPACTTDEIDWLYARAIKAGAVGGKLCGAGAGGFFLFYVPAEKQENVRKKLALREIPFKLQNEGSQVIFHE